MNMIKTMSGKIFWLFSLLISNLLYAADTGTTENSATNSAADNHAVVLLYHHVSESGPASTSVTPQRFRQHMQYLKDQGYQVWPMSKVLEAVFSPQPMPDKVVAITFDDAYRSVVTNGLPILKEFGYPFTFFVDTAAIVSKHSDSKTAALRPSWDDLRELQKHGGTIANHSHTHVQFPKRLENETDEQWAERIRNEITTAQSLLKKELGSAPNWFAYPFGEYDRHSQFILANMNMWAFGQHSGAIGPLSDKLALPRFAVAGQYSDMKGFAQKVASRPLPVVHIEMPPQPMQQTVTAPIASVHLETSGKSFRKIACFSGGEAAQVKFLADDHFTVQAKRALPKGRPRYNCTMPDGKGHFYWLSIAWIIE